MGATLPKYHDLSAKLLSLKNTVQKEEFQRYFGPKLAKLEQLEKQYKVQGDPRIVRILRTQGIALCIEKIVISGD